MSSSSRPLRAGLLVLAALSSLLLAAGVVLLLALQGAPSVAPRADVSPQDVDRAVALARRHDPRRAPNGQLRRVVLTERDVDLLLHHAVRRFLPAAETRVSLQAGRARVEASLPLPLGRWLNLQVGLRQDRGLPAIDALRIGHLPLPPALALPALLAYAERRGVQTDELRAIGLVERVAFSSRAVRVSYRFDADTADRLRAALVPSLDQQRLRAYQERLADLTQAVDGIEVSLGALLRPLFKLAAARTAAGGDAAAENRAALLTLAFFTNHRPLGLMLPAAYEWRRVKPLYVTLHGRPDTAQHFTVSALLAAEAGTPLADAVALWKEMADARRGGSGFSFNDLAADRAGTRFGELAVAGADELQRRAAAVRDEAEIIPATDGLPEFLSEAEFEARYGGVGGFGYTLLLRDIDGRIEALPLLR